MDSFALDLWNSFRSHLTIDLDFSVDGVDVVATITNSSPVSPDRPKILFEDLKLVTVGGKPTRLVHPDGRETQMESRSIGTSGVLIGSMRSGDTCVLDIASDKPWQVRVEITGSVSRREYFETFVSADAPLSMTRPEVEKYLKSFSAFGVVDKAMALIAELPEVDSSTPIGVINGLPLFDQRFREIVDSYQEVRVCPVPAVGDKLYKAIKPFLGQASGLFNRLERAQKANDLDGMASAIDALHALITPSAELEGLITEIKARYELK